MRRVVQRVARDGASERNERASWRERLEGPSIALWVIAVGLLITGFVILSVGIGQPFGPHTDGVGADGDQHCIDRSHHQPA